VWVPWPRVSGVSGTRRKRAFGIRRSACAGKGRFLALMKSSAELIHITGALIASSFGHGL
jgi:hypothetical protein